VSGEAATAGAPRRDSDGHDGNDVEVGEPPLQTERLLLRRWREGDLAPFAAMCADPAVMEYFPATHTAEESAALMLRIEQWFERDGYGAWAVEVPGEAAFIGFIGLWRIDPAMPFAPGIEIGWRLSRPWWGRGLAHEGACAAVRFAFEGLELPKLLAYTAERNARSRRLMERLGMYRDPAEDFDHPGIAVADPLARHVVYRLAAAAWRARWRSD
jgi:RimJ/RimL family protein N-acetyltransferase